MIYLIVLHQMMWTFVPGDRGGVLGVDALRWIYVITVWTGLHALGFVIPCLAGAAFYKKWCCDKKVLNSLGWFWRAWFLIFLGYVMNILTWGFVDAWDWDVLQFIGLSMLVSGLCFRFFLRPLAWGVLIMLSSFSILYANQFPGSTVWGQSYFYHIMIGDVLGGHYWPFVPWYAVFFMGLIIGHGYHYKIYQKPLFMVGSFAMVASLMSGHYFPQGDINDVWGTMVFKPNPLFMIGVMGFAVFVLRLIDMIVVSLSQRWLHALKVIVLPFSHAILWVYLSSIFLGYRLTNDFHIWLYPMTYQKAIPLFWTMTCATLIWGWILGLIIMKRKYR